MIRMENRKLQKGDTCYIIESGHFIRQATVVNVAGGMCLIRFEDGSGTRLKPHRLYHNIEDAEKDLSTEGLQKQENSSYNTTTISNGARRYFENY